MSLRRWAQLASPWGDDADESGGPGAVAAQSLDLDVILDSPLSTYSAYRLTLMLLLSFWWLVATDVYVDIWAAGAPDMGLCTCETATGHGVPFASFNYSKPSDNRHVCHVCAELGGEPRCPADADAAGRGRALGDVSGRVAHHERAGIDQAGCGRAAQDVAFGARGVAVCRESHVRVPPLRRALRRGFP